MWGSGQYEGLCPRAIHEPFLVVALFRTRIVGLFVTTSCGWYRITFGAREQRAECYRPSLSSSAAPGCSESSLVGATLPDACEFIIRQQNLQKMQRPMTSAMMTPNPIASPIINFVLSASGDVLPPPPSGDCVPDSCQQFQQRFWFEQQFHLTCWNV